MRTRRSWRNQERLWKELGGKAAKPPAVNHVEAITRALSEPFVDARTRRMLNRDLAREKIKALLALVKKRKENP